MTDKVNPYQTPHDSEGNHRPSGDFQDLGDLLAEYRVGRVVKWACLTLAVVSVGLCLFVTSELFTTEYDSVLEPLSVLAILAAVALPSTAAAVAAVRTRFALFERGLIHCNAYKLVVFRFAEISEMRISGTPLQRLGKTLNPLKPHLLIVSGPPVTKHCYICPFLISDLDLFETSIDAWRAANGRQLSPD